MVFQYGSFGAPAAGRSVVNTRDRTSLLKLGAPALADVIATLNVSVDTLTKERDGARSDLSVRTQERDQTAAALNLRTQEREQARNERESFRQQAGRVPALEKSVLDLSAVANRVPALEQQVSAESSKARTFEAAANGLKIDVDGLKANLSGVTQMLSQVQAKWEASKADNQRLSADVQKERGSRLSAENIAETRGGELNNVKLALTQALADKDSSLVAAAQQWKGELDAALKSAKESLDAERESARKDRGQAEEQNKSLGQRYEELLKKYNALVTELETERAKSCPTCPVCPVCQDCPTPQPCPECGKASTQSASTDSGSSAWTLLLALGGGYLVGKNLGK